VATHKPTAKKIRLGKANKRNRRVPAWIMMRTNRNFQRHPKRHQWRKSRLQR
jgi:large subunit ribosomal protein L39e